MPAQPGTAHFHRTSNKMILKTVDIYVKDHPRKKVTINESDLEDSDVLWSDRPKEENTLIDLEKECPSLKKTKKTKHTKKKK